MQTRPPFTWQSDNLLVVFNSTLRSNSYVLRIPQGGCVIVDPGLDHEALQAALAECEWRPEAVLCTHGHFDHVGGAARLQSDYHVEVFLHPDDFKTARMSNFLMAAFKIPDRIAMPRFTPVLSDGSAFDVHGLTFRCHAMPGHTPGSVAFDADNLLFSGDSLYARQIGLSGLPGEDHAMLRRSLQQLFSWVETDVQVLPGHGTSATVAEILESNVELRRFLTESETHEGES